MTNETAALYNALKAYIEFLAKQYEDLHSFVYARSLMQVDGKIVQKGIELREAIEKAEAAYDATPKQLEGEGIDLEELESQFDRLFSTPGIEEEFKAYVKSRKQEPGAEEGEKTAMQILRKLRTPFIPVIIANNDGVYYLEADVLASMEEYANLKHPKPVEESGLVNICAGMLCYILNHAIIYDDELRLWVDESRFWTHEELASVFLSTYNNKPKQS